MLPNVPLRFSSSTDQRRGAVHAVIAAILVAFLIIAYRSALGLPFLNDDYLFLDKVRGRGFLELWKPEDLIFQWYRPWSREFHYWAIRGAFGLRESAFHAVSLGLWLALTLLYFDFVRRIQGSSAAAIATAGASLLALWSAPLLWVAGAQDLWMLCFGLLTIIAASRASWGIAAMALLLALLSKETAAVIPGIVLAYLLIIERTDLMNALRRTALLWVLVLAWAVWHPTLSQRFFGPLQHSVETAARPGPFETLLKTVLVQFNLEDRFSPEGRWASVVARGALMGALFAGLVYWVSGTARKDTHPAFSMRVLAFGGVWAALGWAPLFMPSIGWHPYYGVLGTLGCWLALGAVLQRHVKVACAVIIALAVLREARVATPSWDWGSHWYQKRAGSFLEAVRRTLTGLYPALQPHSRLYFARIPNNIGLLAGDGPAIRVWYDDPSLRAQYYSSYVARGEQDTLGCDLFFRYDSLKVLVEVLPGLEEPPEHIGAHPGWKRDHEVLASVLIQGGNLRGAAEEYEKLWRVLPNRPDYALYSATAYEAAGEGSRAQPLYGAAREAFGDSMVNAQTVLLLRSARGYRDKVGR